MSFGRFGKPLRCLGISAFLLLAAPTLSWAQFGCGPCATFGTPCAVGCQTHHCPPAYQHCLEGAPRIHWKCGCPRPVCNPCDLPHWGYFETCWNPWPFPPNWGCTTTPPAAFVNLDPNVNPNFRTPARPMPAGPGFQVPSGMPPTFPNPSPLPNGNGNGGATQLPTPRVINQ